MQQFETIAAPLSAELPPCLGCSEDSTIFCCLLVVVHAARTEEYVFRSSKVLCLCQWDADVCGGSDELACAGDQGSAPGRE